MILRPNTNNMEKGVKKMIKPKDLMLFLASPLLVVAMLFMMSAGGSVTSTKGFEWYFQPNEEHRQPTVMQEVDFSGYDVLYCGTENEKKVSITFDAGYDNGCHTLILDALKEKKTQATFFLDGNFLSKNGDLVKRMAAEGHVIGNHTQNHADMTALTDFETYRKQVKGWDALLQELDLQPSGYFRFPCGKVSERALEYNKKLA